MQDTTTVHQPSNASPRRYVDIGNIREIVCVEADEDADVWTLEAIGSRGAFRFDAYVANGEHRAINKVGTAAAELRYPGLKSALEEIFDEQDYDDLAEGERLWMDKDDGKAFLERFDKDGMTASEFTDAQWIDANGGLVAAPAWLELLGENMRSQGNNILWMVDIGPIKSYVMIDPAEGIARAAGTKSNVHFSLSMDKKTTDFGLFKTIDNYVRGAWLWDLRLFATFDDLLFDPQVCQVGKRMPLKTDGEMMLWLHDKTLMPLAVGRALRILSGDEKVCWINHDGEIVKEPTWFRPSFAVWLLYALQNWIRHAPSYTFFANHINEFSMTKIVMDAYARDLKCKWDVLNRWPVIDGTDMTDEDGEYESPFLQPEVKVFMSPW